MRIMMVTHSYLFYGDCKFVLDQLATYFFRACKHVKTRTSYKKVNITKLKTVVFKDIRNALCKSCLILFSMKTLFID